jgi:hypothetical protein
MTDAPDDPGSSFEGCEMAEAERFDHMRLHCISVVNEYEEDDWGDTDEPEEASKP